MPTRVLRGARSHHRTTRNEGGTLQGTPRSALSLEDVVSHRVVAVTDEHRGVIASPVVEGVPRTDRHDGSKSPPGRRPPAQDAGPGPAQHEQQVHQFPAEGPADPPSPTSCPPPGSRLRIECERDLPRGILESLPTGERHAAPRAAVELDEPWPARRASAPRHPETD